MPVSFERMREMEGKRVRMCFTDGNQIVARLLSATEDIEGFHHLIYDSVEWANDPDELARSAGATSYAEGETLESIDEAAAAHA